MSNKKEIQSWLKELKKQADEMDKLRANNTEISKYYLGMQDGLLDAHDFIKEKLREENRKNKECHK